MAAERGLDDHAVLKLAVLLDALADPDAPTTVHAPVEAVDVHLADSLAGLEADELRAASTIVDIGSGAGLPGLALAAALPDATVTCVESSGRKAAFIAATAEAMGLGNAPVRPIRIEEWSGASCDVVCARAVAPLAVLVEYAAPLLRPGGRLVAWKGAVAPEESEAAGGRGRDRRAGAARAAPGPALSGRSAPVAAPLREGGRDAGSLSAPARHGGQAAARWLTAGPTGPAGSVAQQVMGTVYAIANQKGGVGKTTTAVNVAACIAEAGYETLVVDVDPQGNATVGLGVERTGPGLYEALSGAVEAAAAVRPTGVAHLSMLASTPDLAAAAMELPRVAGSEGRLREVLAPIRDRYAFVVLDCPPALGPLTINALVAADRVIVPVQTEYFALEGLAGLLDTLGLVQRELNPRLTVAGMLLTMHDARTKLAQDVEREVRTHFPELVFETVIPRNVRLGEAPSFGVPVIHHDPHCAGADAYFSLAKEVAARG
jgi:chromosome partitioning protein